MSGSNSASRSPDLRLASRRDALALTFAEKVGAVSYHELLAEFGSASQALDAAPFAAQRTRLRERAESAMLDGERSSARMMVFGDANYPERLRDLNDPPPILWLMGNEALLAPPIVAIVGTRKSTAYGERVTREISSALARAGACVLSGMARGIDGEAHRAALDADGRTIAVLGTGVDIAYPAAHRHLHRTIANRGLLISELPCGDHAQKGSFPRRNRIIAALADVTIVVEAGVKSGATITAGHALDLGRTLAAVPGQIDVPQAAGTNLLLRDGAHVIAEVADALLLAGLDAPRERPIVLASSTEQRVWDALSSGALDMDALCAAVALPARDCIAAVGAMELRGIVHCALTGEIRRR